MKPVIGYEAEYQLDIRGRIWSNRNQKYLTTNNKHGCEKIYLYKNNTRKNWKVHILLALHYIPNPKSLPWVDHINGNRTDNRIANLRWCDPTTNQWNRKAKGVYKSASGFYAQIWRNGKRKCLGSFKTECQARRAYEEFKKQHDKEFYRGA